MWPSLSFHSWRIEALGAADHTVHPGANPHLAGPGRAITTSLSNEWETNQNTGKEAM